MYDAVLTGLLAVSLAAIAVLAWRLRRLGRELAAGCAELERARERQGRVVGWMEEFSDPSGRGRA